MDEYAADRPFAMTATQWDIDDPYYSVEVNLVLSADPTK